MIFMKFYLLIILSAIFITSNALVVDHWKRPNSIPEPIDNPITPQKVKLGKLLFFDKRLSRADDISCATCHDPKFGWSDGSVKTLKDAVHICGNGGKKPVESRSPFFKDREFSEEEVDFTVAFLKTLTAPPLNIEIPKLFPQ